MNIDLDAFTQEFNVDIDDVLDSAQDNPIDIDNLTAENLSDTDMIISTNINKCNAILDRVILEINRAGMTPRLGEVTGQLIANINQAAGQIYTKQFDMSGLRIKKKMLELKEREVRIKELTSNRGIKQGDVINQNLIVTDRETVLKLLKENKSQIKLISQNNENGD